MYIRVDLITFRDKFHVMGRGDNFSYQGLELLFEMCEENEDHFRTEDLDHPGMELDVIALCCDFQEMSRDELLDQYSNMLEDPTDLVSDAETWDDVDDETLFDWLQEQSGAARMGTYSESGDTFFVFRAF